MPTQTVQWPFPVGFNKKLPIYAKSRIGGKPFAIICYVENPFHAFTVIRDQAHKGTAAYLCPKDLQAYMLELQAFISRPEFAEGWELPAQKEPA